MKTALIYVTIIKNTDRDDCMESNKHLYIVISKTATRFGYMLRKVGKVKYNHAAVALDPELNEMYSFARKQYKTPLIVGMVKENVERYTLRKSSDIQVVIFKIPVTQEQYDDVNKMIQDMWNDREYLYNLFSVLTWPVTKGFAIYKAYSCIEFTMTVMERTGYTLTKPAYQYTPDELLDLFSEYIYFQGNILDYKKNTVHDDAYFLPMSFEQFVESGHSLREITKRSLLSRAS